MFFGSYFFSFLIILNNFEFDGQFIENIKYSIKIYHYVGEINLKIFFNLVEYTFLIDINVKLFYIFDNSFIFSMILPFHF